MRIAIDARYLNESYSGIAKYSENLVTHLALEDTHNEYVVFIHPLFNRRLRVGPNFRIVRYPARPLSLRTLLSFGRRVRRMECDFLHSLSPASPILGVDRKILTVHDMQPFAVQKTEANGEAGPKRGSFESLFLRATFPYCARSATWLISVSQATKTHLADLFPEIEHKTIVVHSGVEEVFATAPEATISQMVCKKLNLPPQYILYIGTAAPNKNVPGMLSAFARCREQYPDAFAPIHFILALGRDSASEECRKTIGRLGLRDCVRLLGPITEEEKRVLYARATLLFSVTRGEGFGLPIVEAQASGLPVLAGAEGAVPEVTAGSALLASPDNEEQICRKLACLVLSEDMRSRLAEAGRENVERFSWQRTARQVLQVYHLLM